MTSNRPFSCDVCQQSFTRSENLERHKRARHGGATRRLYECHHCHTRFSRRDVCKRHTERCRGRSAAAKARRQTQISSADWGTVPDDIAGDIPELPGLPAFQASVVTFMDTILEEPTPPVAGYGPVDGLAIPSPSVSSTISDTTAHTHTRSFFEYFHPSLPLIHRPTFTVSSTPKVLLNATAIVGSLYTAHSYDGKEREECAHWRRKLWEKGNKELTRLAAHDWRELRKTWVMQAWLLHIIYGAYIGDGPYFHQAKKMLQSLVDAVREMGLLRQAIAFPDATSWMTNSRRGILRSESQPLRERWMSYVNEESMRVSLYTLSFLDSQINSPCNARPLLSAIELGWSLPYSSSLWEANSAHVWLQRLSDEHKNLIGSEVHPQYPRGMATSSLSLATQELMSENPSPGVVAALGASPIATLCVLTNLDALVRDFTRSYYQLPPSLSDPSSFHILTQSQNRQIMAAVRAITRMSRDHQNRREWQVPIWHAIDLMAWSVKVSLCRPDGLLIGGIVDNSLIAGLATSTHLTLGSYVAVRRSAPSRLQQRSSDEGVLTVLSDLLSALCVIVESSNSKSNTDSNINGQPTILEAPWATATTFRILLMLWQALRRALSEIRKHLEAYNEIPPKFDPSMLIFRTIMQTVLDIDKQPADEIKQLDTDVATELSRVLDDSEPAFMALVLGICHDQDIWGIGPSMKTVLEEIISTSQANSAVHSEIEYED